MTLTNSWKNKPTTSLLFVAEPNGTIHVVTKPKPSIVRPRKFHRTNKWKEKITRKTTKWKENMTQARKNSSQFRQTNTWGEKNTTPLLFIAEPNGNMHIVTKPQPSIVGPIQFQRTNQCQKKKRIRFDKHSQSPNPAPDKAKINRQHPHRWHTFSGTN